MDIKISKAYDSTEHFAKEISIKGWACQRKEYNHGNSMTSAENAYFNCAWTNKRNHAGMRMLGTRYRGGTIWMASVYVLDEQGNR